MNREGVANGTSIQPLAAQLRPKVLDDFVGQEHLLGTDKPLYKALMQGHLHSMLLWGPSGVGKTTLARMLAQYTNATMVNISAVIAGVKEIRQIMEDAQLRFQINQQRTLLFVDEVHRFNKAQQDAFLPYIEEGTVTFIGATTENPSFELNNALLSRARVYVLKPLSEAQLVQIINRGIEVSQRSEMGSAEISKVHLSTAHIQLIAQSADGDARRALNYLQIVLAVSEQEQGGELSEEALRHIIGGGTRRFDKGGDYFYDQMSALHKSVRGSNADAALYWFCRMLDGGCDPRYIARRLIRMASEDIGNADPRGLTLCNDAAQAYERLGSPEGELALAQAVVYLAVCAKSNAVYNAFNQAMVDVKNQPSYEVPMHLRNAPTQLMKQLGSGKGYRYAHDEQDAYAAGENYFPVEIQHVHYYDPVDRGLEQKIKAKLDQLKQRDLNQGTSQ